MSKEFHLYLSNAPAHTLHTVTETENAIKNKTEYIKTTQLFCCTTDLIKQGYKIIIHPSIGSPFEVSLGSCAHTNREIKIGHNLCKMIYAGEFDDNNVTCIT